jgi:putative peptidoglycan lipid II flippase
MTAIQRRLNNIRNILSQEQTEILETALYAMVPVLLTKITGQFFSLIAASFFGTNDAGWNQFLIASSIPDLISNVLITGSFGAIIIPILVSSKRKDGKEAFLRLYSSMVNVLMAVFAAVSVIMILFADKILIFLLDTVFKSDVTIATAEIPIIVDMMRALLVPQLILALSVFISNGLNIYNRYIIPQLAGLMFNIGRIVAVVILVPAMNFSPWAVVIGVYAGSLLHLLIQIPLAREVGLLVKPAFDVSNKYMKELFTMAIPRMFAVSSEHIALTFNDFLAFSVRGVAALNFANSLSLVIPQMFAFTFAYASFTKLSENYEDEDYEGIRSIVSKTMNEMIFLAIPFIVTTLVLRVPIVRLTFGLLPNTRLDLNGTYQIAWVLLWFALGHIFVIGKWFMYRVYYAAKDTSAPWLISLVSLILTIVLAGLFTNLFSHSDQYSIRATQITYENLFTRAEIPDADSGLPNPAVGGIALGMSVAYTVEFIVLILFFHYFRIRLNLRELFAGFIMICVMYLMFKTWDIISYSIPVSAKNQFAGSTTLNLFILTSVTVATSFLVYYAVCLLLKVEELKILKKYINPIFRLGGLRIK